MMEEMSRELDTSKKDGQQIIELLVQAESLLRDELRKQCDHGRSLELQCLLEAQLNVSRALEALYERASEGYTF